MHVNIYSDKINVANQYFICVCYTLIKELNCKDTMRSDLA